MSNRAFRLQSVREIRIGARDSPLSKVQVQEVHEELKQFFPEIIFRPIFVKTLGDKDKKTSLRLLEKTDFFTREIDQLLLKGECRAAIHAAKDLPDPLPDGLILAAITKGIDPADSLVIHEGETLSTLPACALIGTSSIRREEMVRHWLPGCRFVDLRGTIEERLERLARQEIDGLVVAEAALIRLGLTGLNRFRLEGETAPLQGKLAVVIKDGDYEMIEVFKPLARHETYSISGA